ncbi:heterodisulfide reductase subunit F [Desulfovibrio sulfodismutans]|uniref:Heterodisulfide reductase subunit F n=1 Tax=Desulfolutivibrio sulfodismutans TaxID=63561 RepID=A0A7K3NL22_9BACT|nr:FAD/NAD(P)-binding protein [Desulfolutivibrio sulfodismutans]NDY56890.1 heterodisulfide reductase subunit F [Desulfolutivibrio sulfodismutans]QLA10807.1 heterodisulfide reductase subunit F [Desulfolutivibrio sulfodismutans DSM 3696]
MNPASPYLPLPVRLTKARFDTPDKSLRTFGVAFEDPAHAASFRYRPGQFAELSVAGFGEAPIGIASSPTEGPELLFTVSRIGVVTSALHALEPGDRFGVRGPLGNGYPLAELVGKDIVVVAGGYAVTTLRSAMVWLLDPAHRAHYGRITFVYGARSPELLLYQDVWRQWMQRADVDCRVTIDNACQGWDCLVGFVPRVLKDLAPSPENAAALVCGPPAMIRFSLPVFEDLGWQPEQIFMSLENRMKCGIGLCGRCNVGNRYVCKDGPVFTKAELDRLPPEY